MSYQCFSETGINIYSDADFATNTERLNGFQPDTPASSKMVNTVLKETSAFVTAWSHVFDADMNVNDSLDVIKEKTVNGFVNGLSKYLSVKRTADTANGDKLTFSVNAAEQTSFNIENAKHSATSDLATKATSADKAAIVTRNVYEVTDMKDVFATWDRIQDEHETLLSIKLQGTLSVPNGTAAPIIYTSYDFEVDAQIWNPNDANNGNMRVLMVTLPQQKDLSSTYMTAVTSVMKSTKAELAPYVENVLVSKVIFTTLNDE